MKAAMMKFETGTNGYTRKGIGNDDWKTITAIQIITLKHNI